MHRVTPDTTVYWSESMLMYSVYLAVLFRFSAFIINVTARFSLYFIPFLMIAFPHALNKVQNQNNRKLMKIGMITAIVFFSCIWDLREQEQCGERFRIDFLE